MRCKLYSLTFALFPEGVSLQRFSINLNGVASGRDRPIADAESRKALTG